MRSPGYDHNGFVATHALEYIMYVMYTENLPCIKEPVKRVLYTHAYI